MKVIREIQEHKLKDKVISFKPYHQLFTPCQQINENDPIQNNKRDILGTTFTDSNCCIQRNQCSWKSFMNHIFHKLKTEFKAILRINQNPSILFINWTEKNTQIGFYTTIFRLVPLERELDLICHFSLTIIQKRIKEEKKNKGTQFTS